MDHDFDLHHPVQKGELLVIRITRSLFALGFICDCPECDHLVVELKKASYD
jgi:hypothetical protein